jgi:SAM-dependent methyltransferase
MIWLLVIGFVVAACFAFVLLFGAPYLPTLKPQISIALDMLDLKPGDTLLELGCGDGRVMVAAAQRGLNVVGYELNPLVALVAWVRTRRYRKQIRVICGNFWNVQWPPAQGIFTFLLQKYTSKLDTKIVQSMPKPIKLASFAFTIPGKKPIAEKQGMYLYEYR